MEKWKKKNRRRRVFLLALALLFTAALFTTSTYAWFTANKSVKVDSISVNIAAQNGIQISADGTNWKSIVQVNDLAGAKTGQYSGAVNQLPTTMQPVSTIGEIDATTKKLKMFYGQIINDATTGAQKLKADAQTDADGATGNYVAFDLFFKVDSAEDLFLTGSSGVRVAENAEDTGIRNASRIAFLNLGNTASSSALNVIQNIGNNEGDTPTTYIWEPNNDSHKDSAIGHARDNYGVTITAGDGQNPVSYSGLKAAITQENAVPVIVSTPQLYSTRDADYFANVDPIYKTQTAFSNTASNKLQIFSLQQGITKVRVYMWIEGQDVDCENNASGGSISFDLSFTTVAE